MKERRLNEYCHTPRKVLEHLLKSGYESCHDGETPSWWDYATALRGDDIHDTEMIKVLLTCVVRGRGTNDDDDFGAWDIKETIDVYALEYSLDKPFEYKEHAFPRIKEILKDHKYDHYKHHISQGLMALCYYYRYLSRHEGTDKDRKVYADCSEALESMSDGLAYSPSDSYVIKYFTYLHKFLTLVTDEYEVGSEE